MRINASALLSSATIRGLEEDLAYMIQVSASTSAGSGVTSSPQVARTFQSSLVRDAIVGGVEALMLIVATVLL